MDKETAITVLSEKLQEIRNNGIRYYVNSTNDKYMEHIESYTDRARQNKYKAIVAIQELLHELNSKNTNYKRCNTLIDEPLSTDYYKKDVEKLLGRWKSLVARDYKKNYIRV